MVCTPRTASTPTFGPATLLQVLAEPMLGAVVAEAAEAARSGWYWKLKPLSLRVGGLAGGCWQLGALHAGLRRLSMHVEG